LIIIGEKLNSSIKSVAAAIEKKDTAFLQKLAQDQVAAGAHYLDVNTGIFMEKEGELLTWLCELVQEVVEVPLCIDSPNPAALAQALPVIKKKPIINSLSLEQERYSRTIPLVKQYGTEVVALCMDDAGIPRGSAQRLDIARKLVERLTSDGVAIEDIYLDIMLQPIATDEQSGLVALETIGMLRREFPTVHITCGLSNISFELPSRRLLNQAFAVAQISHGMDALIIDPLDGRMMSLLCSMRALMGHDDFCSDYLTAHRSGRLVT